MRCVGASMRLEAARAGEQAGRGSPRAKCRVRIHQQRGAGQRSSALGAPVRRRGQGGWFVRLLCSVVGCECFVRCGVLCGQQRCKHFPSEWSLVGLDLREAGRGHVTPPWARESHILLPEGHFLSLLMASPHWEMLFFPGVSVLQPGFLET